MFMISQVIQTLTLKIRSPIRLFSIIKDAGASLFCVTWSSSQRLPQVHKYKGIHDNVWSAEFFKGNRANSPFLNTGYRIELKKFIPER